jgi:glucosylceramidase
MRLKVLSCSLLVSLQLCVLNAAAQGKGNVSLWVTTPDRTSLLARQDAKLHFAKATSQAPVIEVNDKQRYQTMDGFGYALTGGSAQLLMRMDAPQRAEILKELFGTGENQIGVSYLRVSIGSSDMNDHAFTYDDLAPGETDVELKKFSLGPDSTSVVPALKEILAINPSLKILGTPWSSPAWMKTNDSLKGGSLKPEYYDAYARYFVKYLAEMKASGIDIDAITPQNEPLNPKNTPSLVMQANEEAQFIKQSLGPAFRKANIKTKIILYDHNCDRPDYPLAILADPDARQYVDGSGFHLYDGEITALTPVHQAYPDKNLYFTEQMVVDPRQGSNLSLTSPVKKLIVGAPNNWSKNVILWNLAADAHFGPHTDNGGCPSCQGAITIDGNKVERNSAYYTLAHASKFVRPGSVRIASSASDSLPNVAYQTPDKKHVLIVVNDGADAKEFQIRYHGKSVTSKLSAGAVGTYVW